MFTQNSFTYNGVNSYTDLGLKILSSSTSWAMPERDVAQYEIPGRSGLLLVDNNRWKERVITYQVLAQASTQEDLRKTIDKIKLSLTSKYAEYKPLTDTISPKTSLPNSTGATYTQYNMYRLATFIGPIDWETNLMRRGTCELSFIALPYNFAEMPTATNNVLYNDIEMGSGGAFTVSASGLPKYKIRFHAVIEPSQPGESATIGARLENYKPTGDGDIYIWTLNNDFPIYDNIDNAVGCTHIHLTADTPSISEITIDTLEKEVYATSLQDNRAFSLNAFTDLTNWAEWPELTYQELSAGRFELGYYYGKELAADDLTQIIPGLKIELDWRPYTI